MTPHFPNIPFYYIYTCKISQLGTAAPTAKVLQNTFPNDIVWGRDTTGTYNATFENPMAITDNVYISVPGISNGIATAAINSATNVQVVSYNSLFTPTDNLLQDSIVEIRVYNYYPKNTPYEP